MIAFFQMNATGSSFENAGSIAGMVAQIDFSEWGEFLVFAVVIAISAVNGLIKAAKNKREARQRELQIPSPESSRTPPSARPARERPSREEWQVVEPRKPIPLRPKTQTKPRPLPPRSGPVSESPSPANASPLFETLAEAIRDANKEKTRRIEKAQRQAAPPRQVAPKRKPQKKVHQPVTERHFIEDHEREHEQSMDARIGHVAEGVVAPVADPYAKKSIGVHALGGVDLRQAIILKEILGLPVAMRDTDDYFNP